MNIFSQTGGHLATLIKTAATAILPIFYLKLQNRAKQEA